LIVLNGQALKANTKRHFRFMPRKVLKVEFAEISLGFAGHLRRPGNRQSLFSSQIGEESRPDEQSLTSESLKAEPLIGSAVTNFSTDKIVRYRLIK